MKALWGQLTQDPIDTMDLTMVFSDEELQVQLQERVLPCGHSTYWFLLYWYSTKNRHWIEFGSIHQSDLERVIALLQQAHDYLKKL